MKSRTAVCKQRYNIRNNDSMKVRRLAAANRPAGLREECRKLNEQARNLRDMKLALANVEATLRLLTEHGLNYTVESIDGMEVFNFQGALVNLLEGARQAVDCYDRVDAPSWETAQLRTSAA